MTYHIGKDWRIDDVAAQIILGKVWKGTWKQNIFCWEDCNTRISLLFFCWRSEKRKQVAISFFLQFFLGNKTQGGSVDTITQAARFFRAVIKNMPQMSVTKLTADFSSFHAQTLVIVFTQQRAVNGFGKTWPATARVKFIPG